MMNHALVGFLGRLTKGENAVFFQDQAFDRRVFFKDLGGFYSQKKARHDVGHVAHAFAVELAAQSVAVRLVADRQHGSGMGVIDELMGQEGVQQRLDRRIGRG